MQAPETGEDIWVELKPNIAWFKMIMERIEPVAQKTDDMAVLNALRAESLFQKPYARVRLRGRLYRNRSRYFAPVSRRSIN